MRLTVALAQCLPGGCAEESLTKVEAAHKRAAGQGAQLLVLPEMAVTTAGEPGGAEALDGACARRAAQMAHRCGIWVVHTQDERSADARHPYNVAMLFAPDGRLAGTYRKTHLYDAHGMRESDKYTAGDNPCEPVEVPWGRLAIAICYELRFPEVARRASLAGANMLVVPAAWVDGPGKLDHWRTLLRARAIENELFVLGCCRPHGVGGPIDWVGHSMVVDPLGNVVAEAGPGEELLVATLDTAAAEKARAAMPVFAHRRPELY